MSTFTKLCGWLLWGTGVWGLFVKAPIELVFELWIMAYCLFLTGDLQDIKESLKAIQRRIG